MEDDGRQNRSYTLKDDSNLKGNSAPNTGGASWSDRRATFSSAFRNTFRKSMAVSLPQNDSTPTTTTTTNSHPKPPTNTPNNKTEAVSEYDQWLAQARKEDFTEEKNYGFLYPSGKLKKGETSFH
jgi:hypothetical protein